MQRDRERQRETDTERDRQREARAHTPGGRPCAPESPQRCTPRSRCRSPARHVRQTDRHRQTQTDA
eukprot:2347116-Rhodomonas_salina.1